ncbi:hypothetical protein [Limnoglobus roseus]|uniref:Uncharacterized protein n=1 Tax=Limnoglobus roseus TaxID=2598579 RepID=A0A5C1AIA1_9BACT|nr:hypothetical protein [Limnoglobus roseus]QEL17983.1 hypothetical protein PX52LOC_04997 [Limnoglobus roseus]
MPIKVTCSQCGGILHAPDDSAGKRGRCPTCGTVLTISGETVPPPSQFGSPVPATNPPRSTPPASNPWGSLPGGPEEKYSAAPVGPAAAKPTYELAKESPPRPAPLPSPEPIPPSHGSRVPPDPRKYSVADPFAKPGRPKDEQAVTNRKWRRVRSGLGWLRVGVFFLLLSVVGYAVVPVLQTFNVTLPNESPGFLKIEGYSQTEEIRLFASVGPLVLGLLLFIIGRMGVSAAPAASHARGPAAFSSLATVIAFGGFLACAAITGLAMKDGKVIPQFTPDLSKPSPSAKLSAKATEWAEHLFLLVDEPTGQIQGFGAVAFVAFWLLAEVWFVAALGRMAASLHSPKAAGRVNRFVILVGVLMVVKVLVLVATQIYFKGWYEANVWAKWTALDPKWQTVGVSGALVLGGFILAVLYWRMIGGVRHAILEGVDPNG